MTGVDRILTTGDFSVLSRLSEEWNTAGWWMGPQLRKLLDAASVVFPSDLPGDVASLGSRVAYSEQGQPSRTAELTSLALIEQGYLPVRLPVGLGLLGRREGDAFDVRFEDGGVQRVRLEKVLAQPERTWPGRFEAGARGAVAARKRTDGSRVDGLDRREGAEVEDCS